MWLPYCVPCHVPNEIDYGNVNVERNSGTAIQVSLSTKTTSLTLTL